MKRAFLLSAICLFAITSWAQIKDIEFFVGPNMGMLRSNQINPVFGQKAIFYGRAGYSAGIGSSYYINDKISVGARLFYQRTVVKGFFPFIYEQGRGNNEMTMAFDAISLPVVMRYTIGSKIKVSGEFGGFVNYFINETVMDHGLYPTEFAKGSEKFTAFDAGLSIGISTQIPVSEKLSIKLSVFDNYGLVNISQLQLFSRNDYMRSNTVNVMAGIVYKFR